MVELVTGSKMGLPVMTLLLLIDLALAMLSRMESHLQLLSLAFPVKIALSYLFIAALMVRWPGIYETPAMAMLNQLSHLFSLRSNRIAAVGTRTLRVIRPPLTAKRTPEYIKNMAAKDKKSLPSNVCKRRAVKARFPPAGTFTPPSSSSWLL